jgi:hypothetical protein
MAVVLLGAWHGINPGMGWLFAAALGMQEGRARGALRALPPLALGHALAVGLAVALMMVVGRALDPHRLRMGIGVLLVGYGVVRLVWRRHPRFGGMRVGMRDLTLWSFLMASAHGAGIMVLPFLPLQGMQGMQGPPGGASVPGHLHHEALAHAGNLDALALAGLAGPDVLAGWGAVLLHTGAYLLVTGALAVAVVGWLGLRWLRAFWVDLDRVWAVALVITGIMALLPHGGAP